MYTNEKLFKIKYNTRLDKIEIKLRRGFARLLKIIKKNKFISATVSLFIVFSIINCILIYNFIHILKTL